MEKLQKTIKKLCQELFGIDTKPELSRPEPQFGDYSTNIAMHLAGKLNKNPREIAEAIKLNFQDESVAKVEVAGPGFINFTLTDQALATSISDITKASQPLANKVIVAEYSDPNPFKVLHVGHLYTSIVGDAIANLLDNAGAKTHRVNFGGDVGLHVAKFMWDALGKLGGEYPEKLDEIPVEERSAWMAERYVTGSLAYGDDEKINNEIVALNKRIYQIHGQNDHDSPLAQIYWKTRQWSYDDFNKFYTRLGTRFEKYYPESETAQLGLKIVRENIGKVFEKSNEAVVFKGEMHNMHTRVFINSRGLPTYETKDIGLIFKKWEDYHFDRSIVVTGNDIYEYMQVVLKAVEEIAPELAQKTTHITHGLVKLSGGEKMSSREGNIVKAEDVLKGAAAANEMVNKQKNADVALGAVKYTFLKNRIGADIIFNAAECQIYKVIAGRICNMPMPGHEAFLKNRPINKLVS